MNCAAAVRAADGPGGRALPADVCEEVNRHLAECQDCGLVRQDLQDLARLCRESSGPTTMPEELRGRIAQMLASPDPRRAV